LLYVVEFKDLDTGSIIVGIGEAFEFCIPHRIARQIASRNRIDSEFLRCRSRKSKAPRGQIGNETTTERRPTKQKTLINSQKT
jgi:hypothetical protein